MSCISISTFPATYVTGAITAIKYKDFPAPAGDTCLDGTFIDDFFLFSGAIGPASATTQITIKIGAFDFRSNSTTNTTGSTTTVIASGAIAVSADGKQIDFNDAGGTPRTVNITNGLWADGYSVVIACTRIPDGVVLSPIAIHEHQAQFSMEPESNFTGANPPDVPTTLDGEVTADAIDPTKNNITIRWQEPAGGATPLIYAVERSTNNLTWTKRGFVTKEVKQFTDGYPTLTAGVTYYYRVRAMRKLDLPDVGAAGISGYSNTFSQNYKTPDLDFVASGSVSFGGAATVVGIVNPSGIYTVSPGKTHDTLYERNGTTTATTLNVMIPEPFVVIGYVGND